MIPSFYVEQNLSQKFGSRKWIYMKYGLLGHEGLDYTMPVGTPIPFIEDGVIVSAGVSGNYGSAVEVESPSGRWLYGHLQILGVKKGQQVKAGEELMRSGNAGWSEAPHLHIHWKRNPINRFNGYKGCVDPAIYIANNLVGIIDMESPYNEGDLLKVTGDGLNMRMEQDGQMVKIPTSRKLNKDEIVTAHGHAKKAIINGKEYVMVDVRAHNPEEDGWIASEHTKLEKKAEVVQTEDREALANQAIDIINKLR